MSKNEELVSIWNRNFPDDPVASSEELYPGKDYSSFPKEKLDKVIEEIREMIRGKAVSFLAEKITLNSEREFLNREQIGIFSSMDKAMDAVKIHKYGIVSKCEIDVPYHKGIGACPHWHWENKKWSR
jgi:hypothetical protein